MGRIEIPYEWSKYYETPGYFITYFGEIYFGRIFELDDYPDRFFIIQNSKTSEIRELKSKEKTLEKFQELGREIKDLNVIKDHTTRHIGRDIEFKRLSYAGEQFKKAFIFGAGTSAFCVNKNSFTAFRSSNLCPPLGCEIFSEKFDSILNEYPSVKASLPYFESKKNDVETCFEEEWEIFKSFYNPNISNKHIQVQFYLFELFNKISNEVYKSHFRNNLYGVLLSKINYYLTTRPIERVSLISFNYDTILDKFMEGIYQPFDSMDSYIDWSKRKLLLFKPHGSCNWGWELKKNLINGNTQKTIASDINKHNIEPWELYYHFIGSVDEVVAKNSWGHEYFNDPHLRGRFTINKNLIQLIKEDSQSVYLPSMLIPYRDKDEMVMPYDHFEAMKHALNEVEELFLIGWKGGEKLFNTQLKNARGLKKIIIVNPNPQEVLDNLKNTIDVSKYDIDYSNDFETFVLNDINKYL